MSKLVLIAVILSMATIATGEVSTRVCLADGNTPFEPNNITPTLIEYPAIMVGTKLTIIVSSDVNECWGVDGGSLAIEGAYRDYGVLSARGPKVGEDWSGSHFPAAGNEATVVWWPDNEFDLYTGSTGIQAEDWFIIDYNAIYIGTCNVGFYDRNINWGYPIYYLKFSHVRTRDFNKDTRVDLADFAILTSYWQENGCNDPNWCEGTDLDTNGTVDANDLMLFADYWLERTE
jgi:hypothetical protein